MWWILRFRVYLGDSRVWIICFIKIQADLLDVILDRYTSQKPRLEHKTKLTPAKICSMQSTDLPTPYQSITIYGPSQSATFCPANRPVTVPTAPISLSLYIQVHCHLCGPQILNRSRVSELQPNFPHGVHNVSL